jgi:hypothetical protein
LKNRQNKQTHDEKEWYEQAFGKYRNMMDFGCTYIPKNQEGNLRCFIRINYQMFKEMSDQQFGEFSEEDYPPM